MNRQRFNPPIALFTYNRLWHTQQTLTALQNNELAAESDLYIFSDGPRNEKCFLDAVCSVRDYIHKVDGFRTVTIIERDRNYGLAQSIISGVTEIVNRFGRIIVLEDDMITSRYFLRYMNEALALYEEEDRVISIHGYIYPVKGELPETFFLKGADCWGWGTWKRGWDLFEADGNRLLEKLEIQDLERRFNYNGTYDYLQMLKEQVAGKNDSWAVRWYASALLNDRLTLYPGQSLVQNIGTDSSGVHCAESDDYRTAVVLKPIHMERVKLEEDINAVTLFQDYFYSIQPNFFLRLLRIFKGVFKC